jgi:uncharacterized membrane protein (DUF485 family)
MTALKGGLYVRDFDGLVETLSYLLLLLSIVLLSGTYVALWYLFLFHTNWLGVPHKSQLFFFAMSQFDWLITKKS